MTTFEKMFQIMKKPWVMALYIVLIVLSWYFVDRNLATYVHQFDFRNTVKLLNFITFFGKWKIYVVLFLLTSLYFRYVKIKPVYETRSWYLLSCIAIPELICFILKICMGRARPELLFENASFGFYWFQLNNLYKSFPSGHTTTIVGLASGLSMIFPRFFYAFFGVALLIAATRVLLYYHYLSDVMAGFYISVLVVGLLTQYFKRKNCFENSCDSKTRY